ncbi:unnamed protein product [Rhizoctonia solani]|uniref:Uncharacterized protein n=1 Tax=Rhizoctonia solani TaxID=456999 RepID=A0A8H3E234_9AGAM|nr:unnamed protein product [Rhizoctonia solani]
MISFSMTEEVFGAGCIAPLFDSASASTLRAVRFGNSSIRATDRIKKSEVLQVGLTCISPPPLLVSLVPSYNFARNACLPAYTLISSDYQSLNPYHCLLIPICCLHPTSFLCLLTILAPGASAQAQSNEAGVPFALQSPGQFVQCKNTTIVWQGGKPPYKLTLTPVCDAGKNASEQMYTISAPDSTSTELPINFSKDTPLIVSITDSTNMQATAPQSIVTSGDADDSCTPQIACTDSIQAPSAPNAVADTTSQSTSTGYPTDRLLTANPSATSTQTQSMTDAYSSGSTMFVVYSYASPTPTPSATATRGSESSLQDQPNAAALSSKRPALAAAACMVLISAALTLGL